MRRPTPARAVRSSPKDRARSPTGCGPSGSTTSSARTTCSGPTPRSAGCAPQAASARPSSGVRRASARRRSRACSPPRPHAAFVQVSAIFTGVADLKKIFEAARLRHAQGRTTLLFVDEIHRFNRAQQDGFLPLMEEGAIVLVGATTENPSFELNAALLSRAQVLVLRRLDPTALETLAARAEVGSRPPAAADAGSARRPDRDGRRRRPRAPQPHRGARPRTRTPRRRRP